MKASTTSQAAKTASKKVNGSRLASKKSPFELNQEQRKLAGTATAPRSGRLALAKGKGDKKAQIRAVEDEKKKKDAKLKALSNRIEWLKAEEERTTVKLSQLHNLIDDAEEKAGGVKDPENLSRGARLLSQKEQALRSKQQVKQAKKEHTKGLRALTKENERAARKARREEKAREAAIHKIPAATAARSGESEVGEDIASGGAAGGDDSIATSRQKLVENADAAPAAKKTLSALEVISQRWRDDKQPLRENMELTRKHIMSKTVNWGKGSASFGTEDLRVISVFEYSAGAWKKPLQQ